jgi:hypothetical protein
MRLLAALVLALFAAAAPARADSFGELPSRPVSGVATCLRVTGMPGELARWTKDGVELLRADAGGLTPVGSVGLGRALTCPEVAAQPNGAAIVAVDVRGGLRVALRDAGGGFGAPQTLPLKASPVYYGLAVAVSPRGDAVVAVLESDEHRSRVVAFRRAPGGRFGAPEQLAEWRGSAAFNGIAAGIDGAGRATVAWSRAATSIGNAIEVATAGATFSAPVRVGTSQQFSPSLAVAPDGRVLLAFDRPGVAIAEREPGAASFGAPIVVPGAGTRGDIALALADGGTAAVAWRPDELDTHNGVRVVTRTGTGVFGAPRDAAPGTRQSEGNGLLTAGSSDAPPQDQSRLGVALAGANVVLAWADQLDDGGTGVAQAATGALAGGPIARAAVGGSVRPAISIAPVALADGRVAAAWADDDVELGSFPTGHGRLHLALAGAPPAAATPPPALTVPRLKLQRREVDDPLELTVRCAAACDVRAIAHAGRVPGLRVASRASAGRLKLEIYGFELLRNHPESVRVTLRWAAPGSRVTATKTVRVPVKVVPSPPLPAPVGVRARRSGDDVIVTWRSSFVARGGVFVVSAIRGRDDVVAMRGVRARGRRSFRLILHGAAKARAVTVTVYGASDQRTREKTVRVR